MVRNKLQLTKDLLKTLRKNDNPDLYYIKLLLLVGSLLLIGTAQYWDVMQVSYGPILTIIFSSPFVLFGIINIYSAITVLYYEGKK